MSNFWNDMAAEFAIETPSEGKLRKPKVVGVAEKVVDDEMVSFLTDKGLVLGRGKEQSVYLRCPWAHEHTGDSGISATVYFPQGGRGYQMGHFKCMHAHCAGRTDYDFETALGFKENDFAVVVPKGGTGEELASPPDLPPFQRNKVGRIFATVENVKMAVLRPDFCGWHIAYDEFKGEVVFAGYRRGGAVDRLAWRPFHDTDYFTLRLTLEIKDFLPVSKEMVRDAMYWAANENRVDTAIQWLNGLVWDGVPRVEGFMTDYMRSEDTPYSRAVSMYTWTALAGRVMVPGIKADMLPIWESKEGIGKSSAIEAISPDPMYHTEISFSDGEDKITRKIKGVVVAEISELQGLRSRDAEAIKAFVTRRYEKWVPKYVEAATTYPRRLLFIGTTNETEILSEETGRRRWLPISVGEVTNATVEKIAEDRDQLWAEARDIFKKGGIAWREVRDLAISEHDKYTYVDSWEDKISDWLETTGLDGLKPSEREFLRTGDILLEALGIETKNVKRSDQMRVANIIKKLGYKRVTKRLAQSQGGNLLKVFIKT